MRLDGTTGAVLGTTYAANATDLYTTQNRGVVVGSRSDRPMRFNENLVLMGFLQGTSTNRMFVTQLVPEPSGLALLAAGIGLSALNSLHRRRFAKANCKFWP
jgi:hypothetical protein